MQIGLIGTYFGTGIRGNRIQQALLGLEGVWAGCLNAEVHQGARQQVQILSRWLGGVLGVLEVVKMVLDVAVHGGRQQFAERIKYKGGDSTRVLRASHFK